MKTNSSEILVTAIMATIIGLMIYGAFRIYSKNYSTVVVGGCQYLQVYNGQGWSLTHRGDCTNVLHSQFNPK